MPGTLKVKHLLTTILLLWCGIVVQAQSPNKKRSNKPELPKDSLASTVLSHINDCQKGITGLKIEFLQDDTLTPPQYIQLYKFIDEVEENDSTYDTIELVRIYPIQEIQKQQGVLYTETKGRFAVRAAIKKDERWVRSILSNSITISYCSIINFPPVYNKNTSPKYIPTLTNVQVVEFNIFDRVGETVYTHKNNDISWNGKYPNGNECASGIYYFHCEYIDVANEGKQQSISGMIDLKN